MCKRAILMQPRSFVFWNGVFPSFYCFVWLQSVYFVSVFCFLEITYCFACFHFVILVYSIYFGNDQNLSSFYPKMRCSTGVKSYGNKYVFCWLVNKVYSWSFLPAFCLFVYFFTVCYILTEPDGCTCFRSKCKISDTIKCLYLLCYRNNQCKWTLKLMLTLSWQRYLKLKKNWKVRKIRQVRCCGSIYMGILEGTGLESNREFDNSEFQRADCIL